MKKHFRVLDIFRGVFAIMVVFFHLHPFTSSPLIHNSFFGNAYLFVDFFFILSGFVISHNYQSISGPTEFKTFFRRRFLRLYPLHITTLFLFVIIEFSKNTLSSYVHVNDANRAANNLTSFFTSLFMLNSVKFSHVSDVSWNMPSWSVSGEIIAYLLFGIVIFIIRRLDSYPRRGWVYAFIIAVCLAAFYRISGLAKLAFTFDYGFLRAILGFFSGTLCYLAYCACKPAPGRPGSSTFTFLEMCILLLTAAAVYFRSVFTSEFIYIPLFFSCILIFAFERGAVSRLLIKSPLLIESGKYSYSIYMLHTFLISIFNILFIRILKLPTSAYAYLFIPNLALIFLVSKWSYTHIELRFAKWKRKE